MTKWIKSNTAVAELIARSTHFRVRDLQEQLNMEDGEAKDVVFRLSKTRMIEHTPNGYRKTPPFIRILKEVKVDVTRAVAESGVGS
jgi:hypothetical protein